jgi:acetyl esterase/lipase
MTIITTSSTLIFALAFSFVPKLANAGDHEVQPLRPVRIVRDVEYRTCYPGEDPSRDKNKLDLYLPTDRREFPVLFFVHGGAWRHGDKQFLGIYGTLGMHWARQGIAVVITNYRLSPEVKHPEHIKDVASAFAWTVRNIGRYGGRPDQIFVCGHSAGGHLVSLLATDNKYLKAEHVEAKAIRGVIPISGVFRVYGFELSGAAGVGHTSRGAPGPGRRFTLFASVFGSAEKVRKDASPYDHVRPGLPPFLIFYADHDMPSLGQMAREFASALKENGCLVMTVEAKKSNHLSILINMNLENDPVSKAICSFIISGGKKL